MPKMCIRDRPKGGQNDECNGVFQERLPSTSSTFNASARAAVFAVEVGPGLGRHMCSPSHCWPHQQRPLISIRQVPVPQQRVSCIELLLLVGGENQNSTSQSYFWRCWWSDKMARCKALLLRCTSSLSRLSDTRQSTIMLHLMSCLIRSHALHFICRLSK